MGEAISQADTLFSSTSSPDSVTCASLWLFCFVVATVDVAYEAANNCEDLQSGLLTYDGVHPSQPIGATNLANYHAMGIAAAIAAGPPLPPRPLPAGYAYGGRLFLTAASYDTDLGGIAGADAICTAAAPGGAPLASKAVLVDEDGGCNGPGTPCRRASISPYRGDGQIDWALAPHAVYYQPDNSTVAGFTDAMGLLAFPLYSNELPCDNQASGLRVDWTTQPNGTCASWRRGEKDGQPPLLSIGWSCGVDDGLLYGGASNWPCGGSRLLCATQGL